MKNGKIGICWDSNFEVSHCIVLYNDEGGLDEQHFLFFVFATNGKLYYHCKQIQENPSSGHRPETTRQKASIYHAKLTLGGMELPSYHHVDPMTDHTSACLPGMMSNIFSVWGSSTTVGDRRLHPCME